MAADVRDHSLRKQIPPRFYRSPGSGGYIPGSVSFQIATSAPAAGIANVVRSTIQQVDDNLPIVNARPVDAFLDRWVTGEKTIAQLSAIFGAVALLLASIGLYGVLSFGVARRTGEIGIRMALGAPKRAVIRMILKETGWMVVFGLVGGAVASAILMRLISGRLFGVAPIDPGTMIAAVAVLAVVALVAAALPAHRAARVNPVTALRAE